MSHILVLLLAFTSVCSATAAAEEQQQQQQQQQPPQENLLHSIALGNFDTAYRLLAQGHNPNVAEKPPSGWTPLIHATHAGDFHLAKALLAAGADIDMGCADGWTPIMFASVKGHIPLIRLLLDNGANIHLVASSGATALGSALLGEHPEAIRLIEGALSAARLHEVIFEKEKGVEAIILSASYSGDHLLVDRLLREGHSPNTVSSGGWTPLMLAAAGASIPTLHVLLAWGAEVDVQDHDGWTPLMFCTHAANLPCIQLLLEGQANIFLTNKDNHTVLQMATNEQHEQAFNLIVSMTYCHELLSGHEENVAIMQEQGVDPEAIDCSQVKLAMEEHAKRLKQEREQERQGGERDAGVGVSDSGLVSEPVDDAL